MFFRVIARFLQLECFVFGQCLQESFFLEELDLHSDTETCRILLNNAGEDPEFE